MAKDVDGFDDQFLTGALITGMAHRIIPRVLSSTKFSGWSGKRTAYAVIPESGRDGTVDTP